MPVERYIQVPLTKNKVTVVNAEDWAALSDYNWYATTVDGHIWYAMAWNGNKHMYMHRVIIGAPPKVRVDHRDGDGLNNRRHNIRLATSSENNSNRHRLQSLNTSGFKGACFDKSRGLWIASIQQYGKHISLGRYKTAEEAAKAYDVAAVKLFGEFAVTNSDLGAF